MANPINRQYPQRKSPRLQGYDYSQAGAYFVTICTHQRRCLFGEIQEEEIHLNTMGEIAASCWLELPEYFPQVDLGVWIVMPNHVHGIVVIIDMQIDENGCIVAPGGRAVARPYALGTIINSYKGAVTRLGRQSIDHLRIWQGRFHDHIIRNAHELQTIREYVVANPARWHEDRFFKD